MLILLLIMIYGLLMGWIYLLSEKKWDFIEKYENKMTEQIGGHLSQLFGPIIKLISRWNEGRIVRKGEKFLIVIQKLEISNLKGCSLILSEIPDYKFFTALLDSILLITRKMGVPIRRFQSDLRKNVGRDLAMERKISQEISNAHFQFLIISVVVWSFYMAIKLIVHLTINPLILLLVFSLQIIGFYIFHVFYNFFHKKTFKPYYQYFNSLYYFWGLSFVQVSVRDTLEQSKIQELIFKFSLKSSSSLRGVTERLASLVNQWQKCGGAIKEELESIIEEVWFILEHDFQCFQKTLVGLKFVILCLFFLSGHLLLIVGLFSHFLLKI